MLTQTRLKRQVTKCPSNIYSLFVYCFSKLFGGERSWFSITVQLDYYNVALSLIFGLFNVLLTSHGKIKRITTSIA